MDERALRTLEFAKIKEMLVARVATALGREIAQDLLPSTDYLEVRHRLDETTQVRRLYMGARSVPLGGIHDLRTAVQRAVKGGILEPHELLDVGDTAASGRRLKKFLQEVEEEAPLMAALSNMIGLFTTLESEIRHAITDHGEVADDATPTLSGIRRAQRVIQGRIKEKMDSYVRGPSAKYLQEPIVTIRDDRYVIPVKIEYRSQIPGIVHDQSGSGSTLFIEPMAVVEMNNELKELALKERDEINRILSRLTGLLAEEADAMIDSLHAFAQIDFACAKGRLSIDLDCVEPVLERTPLLEIRKGRHPLLKGKVIPVSIHLGTTFDTLVVTGPNTGGKTVTLKAMGLFVLMTQSGLHLPAGYGTRMGMFDQVFVDIGDEQSIEQSLSTFSGHMTNLVRILNEISGHALVLLDELGAGTDPAEGAALAMSILEHLHARGARTIATTHYSELKTFAYSRPRVENAAVEFDIDTLSPTYRLLIGVPGASNAFEISRRLGLSPLLVERARQMIPAQQERVEDLIAGIQEARAALEKERGEAAKLRFEAQQLKSEYEKRYGGARQKSDEMVEQARMQATQLLGQARREAEAVIAELKAALKQQRESERTQAIQTARARLTNARQALDATAPPRVRHTSEPPRGLKPGDSVIILSLEQSATVLSEPDGAGQVAVQAGILKVSVPLTDLARAEAPSMQAKKGVTNAAGQERSTAAAKARTVATELDLRGLTAHEAIEKVDKYLDDAALAGIPQARIIHGKGTGALRKAVLDHLRTQPAIRSFRLGGMGEGGDGVTIVKLTE